MPQILLCRIFLFIAINSITSLKLYCQPAIYTALVHSRHDTDSTKSEAITAYHFKGSSITVDTIIKRTIKRGSKIEGRLSVGLNDQLIKNRYLYTTIDLLIDVKDKKVLLEDMGDFVKESNDTLFFTPSGNWDKFILNGYSLKTKKISTVIKRPFENAVERISPNYNYLIDISYEKADKRKIYLTDKAGKRKLIVPDIGSGPIQYIGTHSFGRIPVKWLTEETFVYVKYKHYSDKGAVWKADEDEKDTTVIHFSRLVADTLPCCTGEFRLYNVRSQTDTLIYRTDSIYAPAFDDKFLNHKGDLLFRNYGFSYRNYWKLDAKKNTFEPYSFYNTFQALTDTSYHPKGFEQRNNLVLFNGEQIGSFYGQDDDNIDSTFVACGKQERKGKEFIMFWSADSREWIKEELNGFLGLMAFFKRNW